MLHPHPLVIFISCPCIRCVACLKTNPPDILPDTHNRIEVIPHPTHPHPPTHTHTHPLPHPHPEHATGFMIFSLVVMPMLKVDPEEYQEMVAETKKLTNAITGAVGGSPASPAATAAPGSRCGGGGMRGGRGEGGGVHGPGGMHGSAPGGPTRQVPVSRPSSRVGGHVWCCRGGAQQRAQQRRRD
jgi:hypothetical protein